MASATASTKVFYFVEGNIGSGKSTLLTFLDPAALRVVPEPTEDWTRPREEAGGRSLLDLFYGSTRDYGFAFQMHVIATRWAQYKALDPCDPRPVVSERSFASSMEVFGRGLLEGGCMDPTSFAIYRGFSEEFDDMLRKRFEGWRFEIVYVKTDPENCLARVQKRARGEEHGLTLEYLRAVHARQEAMIERAKSEWTVHTIDGNAGLDEVRRAALELIRNPSFFKNPSSS